MTKQKEQTDKCNLCKRNRMGFQGFVWYSGDYQTDLCRSCYSKWCKSKECKSLEKKYKYKKAKPCTRLWHKKCEELQKAFDNWFKIKDKKE